MSKRKAIEDAIKAHVRDGGLVTAPDRLLARICEAIGEFGDVTEPIDCAIRRERFVESARVECASCKRLLRGRRTYFGDPHSGYTCPRHRCYDGKMRVTVGKKVNGGER